MQLDPLSRDYITLAFGTECHVPGFVDAYVGPPEIRDQVLAAKPPAPAALLAQADGLAERVAAGDYPEPRKGYLAAQVRALLTTCRKLAGESIPYPDEVRACFDIEPDHTPETVFEAAVAELDDLLPGNGPVNDRMIAWREQFDVSPETARSLIDRIAAETRERTRRLVDLPEGEGVAFELVSDKPWSGYNWYLGNYQSRVELNTDLPIRANALAGLLCHEAYPGHHTEHALKEQELYRRRGYGEHAIQLINTPECVISEGIATLAETVIFPDDTLAVWQAEHLYPAAGITGDPERETRLEAAQRALRAVNANAALLLHDQNAPEEEVVAYLMRYGLRSDREARQSFRFIADPLWRAYIFTYHAGRNLLGDWLNQDAGDRATRFRTLLTEQIYPSLVQEWIIDAASS